jgi:hypothetical protein
MRFGAEGRRRYVDGVQLFPEVVIGLGGVLVPFIVEALKRAFGIADRAVFLLAVGAGIAVSLLVYAAGFVDVGTLPLAQVAARAVLGGLVMAMTAVGSERLLRPPAGHDGLAKRQG